MNNPQQIFEDSATPSCRMFISIAADPSSAAVIGQCVNTVVSTVLNTEDTAAIELCVVEAINNVVEHGCAGNPEAVIDIELALFEDRIHILIRDDGSAIPVSAFEKACQFNFDSEDLQALPEGGMGLFLITKCMDEFAYSRDAKDRNCLYMTRLIQAAESS